MKSFIFLFFICLGAFAQEGNYDSQQVVIDPEVQGTLLSPKGSAQPPLAILIALVRGLPTAMGIKHNSRIIL